MAISSYIGIFASKYQLNPVSVSDPIFKHEQTTTAWLHQPVQPEFPTQSLIVSISLVSYSQIIQIKLHKQVHVHRWTNTRDWVTFAFHFLIRNI